ncbi:hypothetical protein Pth03_28430 [Planotetraspora thailandica]|uniref:Uncharacterized protein n=1 Tax=Planotetraspora thailandica TaxID=487172 RepID=A0A8J3XVL6_9ACTN|nr:hypothetical protein Pth03_28430 [Planotetraspora thailandica]
MCDLAVHDDCAVLVADDLVHRDGDAAVALAPEAGGYDGRFNVGPLACPVFAYFIVFPDGAALPAVRPHDIDRERCEQR